MRHPINKIVARSGFFLTKMEGFKPLKKILLLLSVRKCAFHNIKIWKYPMVCCYFEVVQLIISTDCSSRLSLSQCFSKKINKPLGISRFWYYERLHFLTESNKSILLRGLKSSIYVKKDMNLQHYSLLDPAQQAWLTC